MRLWALALSLLLVGCIGRADDEPTPVSPAAVGPTPSSGQAELAEANATRPDDDHPPRPPRVERVDFAGRLALAFGVCPPATESHCIEPAGSGGSDQLREVDGVTLGGALNLTWTATAPPTEELRILVETCLEDYSVCNVVAEAAGPSPVALVIPAAPPLDVHTIVYVTMPHPVGPASDVSWVNLPQDFTVDGYLLFPPRPTH